MSWRKTKIQYKTKQQKKKFEKIGHINILKDYKKTEHYRKHNNNNNNERMIHFIY